MYDRAYVAGQDPYNLHDLEHFFPGLDRYHADPARPLATASQELDDLHVDHELSHEYDILCVRLPQKMHVLSSLN